MPRHAAVFRESAQSIAHASWLAREAGELGNLTVGGDATSRYLHHNVIDRIKTNFHWHAPPLGSIRFCANPQCNADEIHEKSCHCPDNRTGVCDCGWSSGRSAIESSIQ